MTAQNQLNEVLERLRKRRASGRRMEVEIGVRLIALRDRGDITDAQFNYVMGIEMVHEPDTQRQPSALNSEPAIGGASDEI